MSSAKVPIGSRSLDEMEELHHILGRQAAGQRAGKVRCCAMQGGNAIRQQRTELIGARRPVVAGTTVWWWRVGIVGS